MSECQYRWTAAYRLDEVDDCVIRVSVRIRLELDPGISAADLEDATGRWSDTAARVWGSESAVERRSGSCPCRQYGVDPVVEWVTRGEHHVVTVRSGNGRSDMGTFFMAMPDEVFAHELGHMLGYPDEYREERCPDRPVTSDNSIMQAIEGFPRPRHYSRLARWLSAQTGCEYEVAER